MLCATIYVIEAPKIAMSGSLRLEAYQQGRKLAMLELLMIAMCLIIIFPMGLRMVVEIAAALINAHGGIFVAVFVISVVLLLQKLP